MHVRVHVRRVIDLRKEEAMRLRQEAQIAAAIEKQNVMRRLERMKLTKNWSTSIM
jgi:hypothetical protein